jgi:hypothetical protein
MSEHPHDRSHRTRHARLFLVLVFVLQRLGDVAVILFTFLPVNSVSLLRGVAIGSLVWTSALLVGVWRRLRWARYALTTFTWGYIVVFTFCVLQAWNEVEPVPTNPYLLLIVGVTLYSAANLILIRSRRVRHFANG